MIIIVLFKQQLKVNNISLVLCNTSLSILIIILSNDKFKFLNHGCSELFNMSDENPIILIFMMVLNALNITSSNQWALKLYSKIL